MATAAYQFKRALLLQRRGVAVRRHADRSRKCTREVESAETGEFRQPASLDALIHVGIDVVPDTPAHLLAQPAAAFAGRASAATIAKPPSACAERSSDNFLKH
jgi:hypothetical protein